MRVKNLDLIAAILLVAINVGWTQLPNRPLVIGIILALPLTFVLPGYTLTQTLFRGRSPDQSLDSSNNLVLRPSLKIGQPVERVSRPRITIYDCILFGLAILIATAAVWFSIIRPLEPQPSFTQFWMLPADQANKSCAVSIGVQNFESDSVTYRVVMMVNGSQAGMWSSIVLAPQEKWSRSVPVKPGAASSLYIEAQLYRADKPGTVYRNVHLTLHSSKNELAQQQCTLGT